MTGPRIAKVLFALLFLFGGRSLFACEIPPELLVGRTLSETREILHGEVGFVADARLHDFEGRTTAVSGRIMSSEFHDAIGCVAIAAKSLDTGIGLRNRLMRENHLQVAQFPEIQFILTRLADVQREANMVGLTLEGDLTLHGVTRPMNIPATLSKADGKLQVEGSTVLKMSDFNIARPAFLFITVKDEVQVWFRVVVGAVE